MNEQESLERIRSILEQVHDPELPGLSIVDLGIFRGAQLLENKVIVEITTTYSGCPALSVIQNDIHLALRKNGYETVEVKIVLSPSWSTDQLTPAAHEKLKSFGIAPPQNSRLPILNNGIPCPNCASDDTTCTSEFGSTPCKSFWKCSACGQPFEYFKSL